MLKPAETAMTVTVGVMLTVVLAAQETPQSLAWRLPSV